MDGHLPLPGASTSPYSVLGNYRVIKNLGHGAFGEVKLAQHLPTGCKVAIKILNRRKIRENGMDQKVEREIKISKMLVHPHIIRLYEVIETATDIYMVMEFAERGDLCDYIMMNQRAQEEEARKFFQQIISGVEYCHKYKVVHRDLKADNLLLDSNGNLKIADFGLSNIMLDGHFLKTSCGSPNYAAPEVISGKLYAGPEIDVWSCGVILYALLAGTLPFDDGSFPDLYRKIKGGMYTLPSHLPSGAKELIARMLVVDPIKRITIPEIRQSHWFRANLPCYLAAPLSDVINQMRKINEEILERVIMMGFGKSFLVQSLEEKIHNEGTMSYYLLLDNYNRANSYYSIELEMYQENYSAAMQIGESSQSAARNSLTGILNHQQGISLRPQPQSQSSERWGLGLQFGSHPLQIMAAVLGALQKLNVGWKKIGQYNMKCRWSPTFNGHTSQIQSTSIDTALRDPSQIDIDLNADILAAVVGQNTVKFELQLYKTLLENNYLLDLQRVMGPQLLFLDLCTNFLSQLQII
ncbi:hypothetical protein CRG98_007462 [Punica granatum]|uniref:non-specific serine/threonine protein kinase n=1 Tax=Punica granatum TaxID=22663 RepID=A0A2I0KUW4_PUNGR|nr:hypothetical protein CRG98_007462 [Punica granatum]